MARSSGQPRKLACGLQPATLSLSLYPTAKVVISLRFSAEDSGDVSADVDVDVDGREEKRME